ncbi:MAG: PDZ domain-containing protein [Nitriliruptoraceae bacterium]
MTHSPPGSTDGSIDAGYPRGGWGRSVFHGASVAAVLWASVAVPLPFVEYLPSRPQAIAPMISIEDYDEDIKHVDDEHGHTAMLTVVTRQQPTLAVLAAWFDQDRRLLPVERVFPQDLERSEYRRLQRERFSRQFEVAAAVGARAAGVDAQLVSEVVVVDVVEGSAAEGTLHPGDVIRHVNGVPIEASDELSSLVANGEVGDALDLTVVTDGEIREVTVRLGALPGVDGPRLGITIQTAVDVVRLPFEIALANEVSIGGPSAGLMIGLTVYAMLSGDPALDDLVVTGTGSLDANGGVGSVGGVPEKVRAAVAYGADVVFVPHRQIDEALSVRGIDGMTIIGVATLSEAIEALQELRRGRDIASSTGTESYSSAADAGSPS